MNKIENFNKKIPIDYTSWLKSLKDSELSGFAVIFDITDSTKLKQKRDFPNWIQDWHTINGIITTEMAKTGIEWYKFLGDAFLFFFPETENNNYPELISKSPKEIFEFANSVMDLLWSRYKDWKRDEKGTEKGINYRELTCAIDYGKKIINWYNAVDDNQKGKFDPIGPTIDRCFRISSLAGPNQILASKYYYDKLCDYDTNYMKEFLRINIAEKSLKGFEKETCVFYRIPEKEKIEYILNDSNVDLVEEMPKMSIKEKLHLFRHTRKMEEEYRESKNGKS
ncbi:hypothetical protein [Leptospira levettii]|uniref:hypothetical protein n=1 Tax=Leptospira levettii TaxID=2023178 RepID=UPI001EFA1418|nr:hypothetical protein [Leptospira levettii]